MILRANVVLLLLVLAVYVSDSARPNNGRRRVPPNGPNRRFSPQHFRVAARHRSEGPVGPPRNFRSQGEIRRAPQNFRNFGGDIRRAPQNHNLLHAPARPPAPPGPPSFTTPAGGPPGGARMPGIRPPKGVALKLNLAKHKDFMSLGAFLLQRFRALMHRN